MQDLSTIIPILSWKQCIEKKLLTRGKETKEIKIHIDATNGPESRGIVLENWNWLDDFQQQVI